MCRRSRRAATRTLLGIAVTSKPVTYKKSVWTKRDP